MKLKPLHDKVLVKRTATEKPSQGEVVAVGPGKRLDNGDIAPIGVNVGDLVIFGQYGGNEIKIDGDEYLILSESDIYGIFS
jgi:chaperonin GroES